MYKEYLEIKQSKSGKGTFTKIDIPSQVPILEMTGDLFARKDNMDASLVLQVSHDTFLGPSGDIDDLINHSCNPNCYIHIVGLRAILFSRHFIKAGTELSFDFSTTDTSNLSQWSMNCSCGSFNCRKVISGFYHLDDEKQKEYKTQGIVPLFINNTIIAKK